MAVVNDHQSTHKVESGVLFPPSWQGLRQQIIYLAQFGNSIQVIHGKFGAGKSTFFRHLLDTGLGSPTIGVQAQHGAGVESFFRAVLEELGLRPELRSTVGELIAALRGYVQTLHKERSRTVLLVDDAHELSDSELGALVSVLQGHADPGLGLHVVLFAEPGFAARVDNLQVLDVAVHDAPLPLFSPAEIQQLIKIQQIQAGGKVDSPEAIQRIWHQSQGLPGAALDLVEDLHPASPSNEGFSLRGLPLAHFAALIVLCGILIWAFWVREPEDSPPERPKVSTIEIPAPGMARSVPPETSPLDLSEEPFSPAEQEVPAAQGDLSAESPAAVASTVIATSVGPAPSPQPGADFDGEPPSNTATEPPKPVLNPELEPVHPAVPPAAAAAPAKQTMALTNPVMAGEKQLLEYAGNAYVLQLMATGALDKLTAFVAEQPNKANLHIYSTKRDGKDLFILVEGYYADKNAAQAAIENLPEQQRKSGPWPKKLDTIQQEIRKNL